jgi:hypothetical protein
VLAGRRRSDQFKGAVAIDVGQRFAAAKCCGNRAPGVH